MLEAAARPSGSALSRVVLRPRGGVLAGAPWSCECLALWPPVPSLDTANLAWADHVENALRAGDSDVVVTRGFGEHAVGLDPGP